MELSTQQLNDIEEYASIFFSYKQIAISLKINIEDFIDEVTDESSQAYIFYQAGKMKSEIEIRKQIIQMAKLGSPAAQTEAIRLMKLQKLLESEY